MKSKGALSIQTMKRACQTWILEDCPSNHFRQTAVHKDKQRLNMWQAEERDRRYISYLSASYRLSLASSV